MHADGSCCWLTQSSEFRLWSVCGLIQGLALQAARKELHEQGQYLALGSGSPANSLPSPDTLAAAIHVPSPLKDDARQQAIAPTGPAADNTILAARSQAARSPGAPCAGCCKHDIIASIMFVSLDHCQAPPTGSSHSATVSLSRGVQENTLYAATCCPDGCRACCIVQCPDDVCR